MGALRLTPPQPIFHRSRPAAPEAMQTFQDKLFYFLFSQALVWGPLLLGRTLRKRGVVAERAAKPLHTLNLACITPVVYGLGVWRLDRSAPGWWQAPVAMAILLAVITAGAVWSSFHFVRRRETAGACALMLAISNTGHTMAGFLTLLLLSDAGYSFNSLMMIPLISFVSLVWFPLAMHWSRRGEASFFSSFARSMLSGQSLQMVGLTVGMALNYFHAPMSRFWIALLKTMVFGGTALVMFAMGLKLRFTRLGGYQKMLGWVYLSKFLVSPLIAIGLCALLGMHGVAAGALFLAAIAPVGVNSVAFSTLFDLDVDLANAGYLWSTLIFMLGVLPFVIWILHTPFFMP